MIWVFALFIQSAWGAEGPSWVNHPPPEDGTYRYYVGRSSEEKNLSIAWRVATQDAYETAIRENFGVATSIQVSNFESLDQRQLDKRVDEKSQRVRLERFEQRDSFVSRSSNSVDLYLLFRFPIDEINRERTRLANSIELPERELTEMGENSSNSSTSLRIESAPSGADVIINESRWGVTPLLIKGVLPVGIHELSIRHPQYQDVNEKMVLIAGKEKSIRKVLLPAQGWLRVETTPSNAQISINGSQIKDAGVDRQLVPAGRELEIKVSHSDCETIIRVIKVAKNELREVHIELPMLPDRNPKPQLNSIQGSFWPVPDWYQDTWIWGIGTELSEPSTPYPYNQSTLGFGLTVERRFFYRFGIRAKLMYDMAFDAPADSDTDGDSASSTSSSSTEGISGTSGSVGVPIHLSSDSSGFYIMPEVGRIARTIPETYSSQPRSKPKEENGMRYDRRGITVGYQDLIGHYDIWVSRYQYDWEEAGRHTATLIGISWTWGVRQP